MTINWTEEVAKRKDDLLADLNALLSIDSVRNDDLATEDAPVGPGPRKALEAFLAIGERDGFITKNVDNLAGHIEFGQGEELMGVFGHVDVVPVGTGWDTDPFTPTIKDNRLYARGSSDDKGPTVAAYYAIKMIKELGLPVSKTLRLIIGTDEESGWKCMTRYLEVERTPDFGFSPDADFPIINGEKGILTLHVSVKNAPSQADTKLVSFEAGLRENMVPQDASALFVTPVSIETLQKDLDAFVNKYPITATLSKKDNTVRIDVVGKASHGMAPMNGVNAGTYLAVFLNQYHFEGHDKNFLSFIEQTLHLEHYGEKLGLTYTDKVMGELTMNPGVFTYNENGGKVLLNFRYPQGITAEEIKAGAEKALVDFNVVVTAGKSQIPHYVPASDPLVKTLLDVYEKHTGHKGVEKTIGGGTYGRLLKRGVAYGAMFPHSIDTMHQANEFIDLDDLFRACAIYAEAIYELVK
ncbi:dipeptidase PepV [Granulicatella sp. zg-ZJ]|uniref:dipeptidase PepV n=1 Tax=unclassified Granulicatella TaxID=2630493 RepID=UPI0013C15D2D|nr:MULTISPECIES: dipeptidase PepV [unclassified Granulicatella]NEW61802.1 dipeptidase PepV [Granulicatella sp. zg-ZJ]NEW65388.1 dipeptidase PepV [Granulicatella sp. zg-84]QMI85083.1 dipeptidase PepV [Carnobacteriaceae bacterium zg-84]